jgi:hypothetical protein
MGHKDPITHRKILAVAPGVALLFPATAQQWASLPRTDSKG